MLPRFSNRFSLGRPRARFDMRVAQCSGWLLLAWLVLSAACSPDKAAIGRASSVAPSRTVSQSPLARPAPPTSLRSRASTTPVVVAVEPPVLTIDDSGIRQVIEAALHRKELPGCVVAIGSRQGLHYLQAFGERTSGEPMTLDTRFDLASLTKPVATAASVMLLAERGVLDLSARASAYLPELNVPDKRAITLEQLLLHTSGLPKVNPLVESEQGRSHARRSIAAETLLSPPGSHFEYSDLGFILLGEVVANVTSLTLDGFAESQLFAPLAMHTTHFNPTLAEADRYAPTELRDDVVIRGVVDDPRAYRLSGVAGHAGLFSTAHDLSRFSRMLLGQGELEGVRVMTPATVARFLAPHRVPGATRSLGFDVLSPYAHGRGRSLSDTAVGHGGYTGTSLWIDPERDLFVLLLSNRVHVGPRGTIHPLASSLADLASRAVAKPADGRTRVGIDVLKEESFARLRGRNVAVLSHMPARDARGLSSLGILARTPEVMLKAILSPEHGLLGRAEGRVANGSALGVPMYSLFGRARKPTAQMLAGVDTIVVDLVDVGTRFYTYMATALRVLEAAAEQDLEVVLLDRPNPLDGVHVEGPISEPRFESFVNYYPLPLRHGLSAGELLRLLARARGIDARLHVVKVEGWLRRQWFPETGLTWHAPSPNLPSPAQTMLYPAVGLIEGTNLSVGRGTPRAFSVVGAPFIDSEQLARALVRLELPGVRVSRTSFRPRVGPYAGELLPGVAFELTDPHVFSATATGLGLAAALRALYPRDWDAARLPLLVANQAVLERLQAGALLPELVRASQDNLQSFQQLRMQAQLYAE